MAKAAGPILVSLEVQVSLCVMQDFFSSPIQVVPGLHYTHTHARRSIPLFGLMALLQIREPMVKMQI